MTNIVNISNQNNITNATTTTSPTTIAATNSTSNSTIAASSTLNNPSTISNNNLGTNSSGSIHNSSSQETCLICGDVASGKHYGLRSCEACKAFFKRTVQGKIEYSCPATRQCEINKRRRKACQACRFQKCLNMGMLKEGVRLDRVRGGRQKYRRGTSPLSGACVGTACLTTSNNNNNNSSSASVISIANNGNNINGQANILSSSASLTLAGSSSGASAHIVYPLANVTSIAATHQQTAIGTGETNKIMTALINCEPEELCASPGQYVTNMPSNLSVQLKTLYILSDLFDRELVSLIGWAKQIPGFSETITLNDQMRLLQSTWAEIIALSIGYKSHLKRIEIQKQQHGNGSHHFMNTTTPSPTSSSPASTTSSLYNSNNNNSTSSSNSNNNNSIYNLENTEIRLVFAKDLIIDSKHATTCGAEEIFYNCVQLIKRLDYLKITPKEYILLKAISLLNADVRLENPRATFRLRDLVMDALYEVTLAEYLNGSLVSADSILPLSDSVQVISGNSSGSSTNNTINHQQQQQEVKMEAQERPASSMNQYASSSSSPTPPPPPRLSSSIPQSSSASSISSRNSSSNNNNNNNNSSGSSNNNMNVTMNNSLDVSKRTIINNRMNQVLLCLPVLRQIDSCIKKFWNDIRKGPNNVPMNKLFEEMLEPCQRMYRSSTEM